MHWACDFDCMQRGCPADRISFFLAGRLRFSFMAASGTDMKAADMLPFRQRGLNSGTRNSRRTSHGTSEISKVSVKQDGALASSGSVISRAVALRQSQMTSCAGSVRESNATIPVLEPLIKRPAQCACHGRQRPGGCDCRSPKGKSQADQFGSLSNGCTLPTSA